jgi:hypothetical protein
VTVDAVVAGVQPSLDEPRIVAALEAAGVYRLKVTVPREQFARKAAPELFGFCDGLLVQLLVLFEAVDVWFRVRVLPVRLPSAFACSSLASACAGAYGEGRRKVLRIGGVTPHVANEHLGCRRSCHCRRG